MGRYQTEAAYLKSVLLWLQGNWAEPDPPRFYPLRRGEQGSRSIIPEESRCIKSARRDRRSTGVLAGQKYGGAPKRLTHFNNGLGEANILNVVGLNARSRYIPRSSISEPS